MAQWVMIETTQLIEDLLSNSWKELLRRQLAPDPKEQSAANHDLWKAIDESHAGRSKDLWVNAQDVPRLIQIGMTARFPLPRAAFTSAENLILGWFWTVRHPSVVPAIAELYKDAPLRAKMDALVILAVQRTPEALGALVRILVEEGFPEHMHPRFFWELNQCSEFADLLLPDLILLAGAHVGGIVDFINVVDASGRLESKHLGGTSEFVEKQAATALELIKKMQQPAGSRWRYDEAYLEVSMPFGAYLDLLGLDSESSTETLHAATTLSDTRLQLIAAVALMKRGVEPPATVLEEVAASHACRRDLYRVLSNLGRQDLFPQSFLSFEAFTASHMVSWLAYPSELGHEPEYIELHATVRGTTAEGPRQWCLWKFCDEEGATFAGVSGPYHLDPSLDTLTDGGDTFSKFTLWEEATPEQHLASILETLNDWRISLCSTD